MGSDSLIPRQFSSGTRNADPALSTQCCPQKMASHVKFPLCFTRKSSVNAGNLFEGYVTRDVISFTRALPPFPDIFQCAKIPFTPELHGVEFSGTAGGEKTRRKKVLKGRAFYCDGEYVWKINKYAGNTQLRTDGMGSSSRE